MSYRSNNNDTTNCDTDNPRTSLKSVVDFLGCGNMGFPNYMKLNLLETKALVKFWETYMSIRKAFESHQDARIKAGMSVDYKTWLEYQELKTQAREDLETVIPEINYEGFWRDVAMLKPDSLMAGILQHRKQLQTAREQRAKEKQVLTGGK